MTLLMPQPCGYEWGGEGVPCSKAIIAGLHQYKLSCTFPTDHTVAIREWESGAL